MLNDPFMVRALAILSVVLAMTMWASWGLSKFSTYLQHRTPAFRRELDATYRSFHHFLMTVRAVAVRALYD
jgi:hypothetical protein